MFVCFNNLLIIYSIWLVDFIYHQIKYRANLEWFYLSMFVCLKARV